MCTLFSATTVLACSGCDLAWLVSLAPAPNLDSVLAANIPWMGIAAVSMHTRAGIFFLLAKSNLAVTTWRYLGVVVTSCAILTNHALPICVSWSGVILSELYPVGPICALSVWGVSLLLFLVREHGKSRAFPVPVKPALVSCLATATGQ
jgi:hypothetical protein